MNIDGTVERLSTTELLPRKRFGEYMVGFDGSYLPTEVADERRAMSELIASGAIHNALKASDRMPSFILSDADGRTVEACDLLAKGPLVVAFYRGVWCPYCNSGLRALEEVRTEIEARGANVVAVSQQTAASSRKSKWLNKIKFPVLVDKSGLVSAQFGVRWSVPGYLRESYRRLDIDLTRYNGDEDWTLPMSALFVARSDGVIAYAEVDPDVTRIRDPSNVFPILDRLKMDDVG
jgi:peroxiredoxin